MGNFKLVKIRKRFSIKNNKWETLDSYNLDFVIDDNELKHINDVISKQSKTTEEFKDKIQDYIDSKLQLDDLEEHENTEDEPTIENISKFVSIPLFKNRDWTLDWKKTAKMNLNWAEWDEFKDKLEDLFTIAKEFPTTKEDILWWIWYQFKLSNTAYDVYQEKMNDKIALLKERQDIENEKLKAIYDESVKMFKETNDDTIKTEYLNYAVTKTSSVEVLVDSDEITKKIPRRFYSRKVILKPDLRAIKAFIASQKEKEKEVDFAKINHQKSLKLKLV